LIYYYNKKTGQSQWTPPDLTPQAQKVRASHILVKHSDSRRPSSWRCPQVIRSKEEAFRLAQDYRDLITTGQISFEEVARAESDCSSARVGGDLGFILKGQMQPVFERVVFGLEVGELSEPVWSDSGVHLILRTV
ncbi:Peptidyl-prolyl cis-trans isomerase NIMA-interacting protein 1, partial [Spiromyces aspiralis]